MYTDINCIIASSSTAHIMKHILLPLITLLALYHLATAAFDFCDADPWVNTTLHECSNPGSVLITLERINKNPYHALHETLWALSHYVLHCTENPREDLVISLDDRARNMNFSKCMQTDSSAGEASPKWGTCVLYFMLRNAGVPAGAIVSNEEEVERRRCYAKTVHLSQKRLMEESTDGTRKSDRSMFARTDWYGRDCAREKTGIGNAAAMCNISSAIGSGLAPLPDTYKREAFEALRTASTNVLSNEPRAAGDKIRVLLYNRLDTNRRKWVNSEQVYQKLRRVGNVEIRYIHATPPSFIEQLRLFSWADILIAPHGAATANSIFMSSGTDIVEIWGVCSNDISDTRYLPRSWTGWHAHLLNLNLQYAQCAMQTGEADPDDATSSDGAQVVIVEGVMRLFGHALERQRFRMRHLSHSEETETRVERMTDAIERRVEFSVGRAFCISILAFGLGVLSSRRANGKGRTGQFGSPRSPKLALWKHRPCP